MKTRITTWVSIPLMLAGTLLSCKKDKIEDSQPGTADVTITMGSQQMHVKGPCGWASAAGVNYIGANHETNNLRVFGISFNIENPPTATTTYTLVDDQLDESPAHVTAYFTEVQGSTFIEWTSFDGSGNVTLQVSGKKITVNLDGIVFEPHNGNAAPYNANGTLSGSLTFYRE